MAVWPEELPCPPIDSWQAEPTPRTVGFDTDSGVPRHRQVNPQAWWRLTFTLGLNPDTRAVLETFCEGLATAVDEGFEFTRPDTGATVTCRFTADGWPVYRGLGQVQSATMTLIAEPS